MTLTQFTWRKLWELCEHDCTWGGLLAPGSRCTNLQRHSTPHLHISTIPHFCVPVQRHSNIVATNWPWAAWKGLWILEVGCNIFENDCMRLKNDFEALWVVVSSLKIVVNSLKMVLISFKMVLSSFEMVLNLIKWSSAPRKRFCSFGMVLSSFKMVLIFF